MVFVSLVVYLYLNKINNIKQCYQSQTIDWLNFDTSTRSIVHFWLVSVCAQVYLESAAMCDQTKTKISIGWKHTQNLHQNNLLEMNSPIQAAYNHLNYILSKLQTCAVQKDININHTWFWSTYPLEALLLECFHPFIWHLIIF